MDTDGDRLSDGAEVMYGTDLKNADSDGDGLRDGSDVEFVQAGVAAVPATSFNSGEGTRRAILSMLDDVEASLLAGQASQAVQQLQNLRQHLDGCGSVPDNNDWIVNCADQAVIRSLIDLLIANLSLVQAIVGQAGLFRTQRQNQRRVRALTRTRRRRGADSTADPKRWPRFPTPVGMGRSPRGAASRLSVNYTALLIPMHAHPFRCLNRTAVIAAIVLTTLLSGTSVRISAANTSAQQLGLGWMPKVAIDRSGHAVAVWYYYHWSENTEFQAARYTPGVGWSPAETIGFTRSLESPGYPAAFARDVGMDDQGRALAVWEGSDGVKFRRFLPGIGWEPEQHLGGGQPVLAVEPGGDAFVVVGTPVGATVRRYFLGVWGLPELLHPLASGWSVAVDGLGNATVAWTAELLFNPINGATWWATFARQYRPVVGWGPPLQIGNARSADVTHVAMSRAGTMVTWGDYGYSPTYVWTSFCSPLGTWDPAYYHGQGVAPQVGIDDSGRALVMWGKWIPFRGWAMQASTFGPGTGWTAPAEIGPGDWSKVAVNAAGKAVAAWHDATVSSERIYGWKLDLTTGSSSILRLGYGWGQNVAINPGGTSVIGWATSGGVITVAVLPP